MRWYSCFWSHHKPHGNSFTRYIHYWWQGIFLLLFLDATKHLYKKSCLSVCLSVRPVLFLNDENRGFWVGLGTDRSLAKLIVEISVWRINLTAETDQFNFASLWLFLEWNLEITHELRGQLCSNMALLKGAEKLCHTMFSKKRKTVALSRHNFTKVKNLKKTREFF